MFQNTNLSVIYMDYDKLFEKIEDNQAQKLHKLTIKFESQLDILKNKQDSERKELLNRFMTEKIDWFKKTQNEIMGTLKITPELIGFLKDLMYTNGIDSSHLDCVDHIIYGTNETEIWFIYDPMTAKWITETPYEEMNINDLKKGENVLVKIYLANIIDMISKLNNNEFTHPSFTDIQVVKKT